MLRIRHCPDNRLTVGGEAVSLTGQSLLYSQETFMNDMLQGSRLTLETAAKVTLYLELWPS
jgi:hypothetical protein